MDLREQLLRAGLVTEAQAEKVAEATGERDPQGGGGRRRRGGRGGGGGGGSRERVQATPYRTDAPSEADRKQAHKLASSARQENALRGGKRFYYVSRSEEVPFIEVHDEAVDKLTRGELAIVESAKGDTWIIPASVANELGQLDPSWIRVWNHG